MANLVWKTRRMGGLVATGDNGIEYRIKDRGSDCLLVYSNAAFTETFESPRDAMEWAENHASRDEDPNNTFRDDFAGFAPNH